MATQEKLHKSLEALKNLGKVVHQSPDVTKKKGKNSVLLRNSVEALLRLCDDQESDVRMTSEECLTRIIRAANDGHIGKIQIELHKEIKKNGAARPLRTALWLFSMLAHHIRPHKGKPYVVNMFPSLIKIAERTEESIHETLAISLPKIMKVLGCFSSENEIKVLLKAFLANVSVQSTVIRRTTSSCILSICMNCRKPYTFIMYCLNHLLDLIIPVNESQTNSLILGVLSCIKALTPDLKNSYIHQEYNENYLVTSNSTTEKLLHVYELCLYYLTHKDHNIVNVCLETLNVLLQNCTNDLKAILLSEKGISNCRIYSMQSSSKSNPRSPSQMSAATNITTGEENLFSESELTETVHSDIEKWIDASKLSVMNITFAKTKEKSQSLDKVNMCVTTIDDSHNDCNYENINKIDDNYVSSFKTHSIGDNLDRLSASEKSSEKSLSYSIDDKILNVDNDTQEIDIGEFLDKNIPIIYCVRLITKMFLLAGTPRTCIPDKSIRVSVKSLALSCLSSIFFLYPAGFLIYLDKNYSNSKVTNKKSSSQRVSDVLLFKNHCDPQLRGAVRTLIANFIKAVSILSEGDYEKWISINGLEDESSNCIRQTLISLSTTLKYLAESQKSTSVISLLNILPLLSKNPYWLVKVALCDLVSKIDYITLNYTTDSSEFQNKVLFNILLELLGDSDQRVRTTAANSVVQIIPYLHYEEYQIKEEATTSKVILEKNILMKILVDTKKETNLNKKHFIRNMPFPFNQLLNDGCDRIDFSLSKIMVVLYNTVLTTTSKHLISGCVETLSLLSAAYPCTVYTNAWCTSDFNKSVESPQSKTPDLLSLCISLLRNSVHVYDLQSHINILNLAANLYAGQSLTTLKPVVEVEGSKELWDMFSNSAFCDISEQYTVHIVKLLNVFHHILNETMPIHPQSKAVLPTIPTTSNLSPIKRRKSDLDKKVLLSSGKLDKEEKSEKREGIKFNSVGMFVCSPHYMKIFDVLKSSFTNYKISLESEASKKFLELLNKALHSLSVLMEVGTLNEFSRIAEDILCYLRSTFAVEAPATVQSVQQLLKCLFGTNLTSNISEFVNQNISEGEGLEEHYGFYYNIFQKPYTDISASINSLNNINKYDCDSDSTLMGYLHRKDVKKRPVVLSRSSDKVLANYIRIFEPMVIKSLKQYTVTSDVKVQCRVLQLLNQLVQLRVNYCLLDSEQVFIGFVLKQFEYIEEGQVPLSEYKEVISLMTLILEDTLNPSVFKPFDEIIIMFFQEPPLQEHCVVPFSRWLSKILILLLILTPLKEETLLIKINNLKSEFSPNSIFENVITKADPLNVNNNAETFQKISAELIFIRFIFRVVSLTSRQCLLVIRNEENSFLIEQFSVFLMQCLYIFQSGKFN
ncbi:hypothetical protein NQ314_019222 [Rhamnusium bicolor]|uniref:Huntingtin n=1 Tax=Rhamnusium bicolor TaxID=1586634 RepID=A0AAV8WRB2_9CUCU|nr:hypothetical protein NQ314_019222 [Rhamnusium bicolor]